MPQRRYPLRLWSATALAASGTLETGVIDCRTSDPEGLMLKVSSAAGTADAKLEVSYSNDGTTFNAYTAQDPISTQPEDFHLILVPWAPYLKLKLTELSASNTDTVVTGVLWMTEI